MEQTGHRSGPTSGLDLHAFVATRPANQLRSAVPVVLSLVVCVFLLVGCGSGARRAGGAGVVSIVAYNVENLFDDVSNGTEYPEFDPKSSSWNSELYHRHLDNVAKVITDSVPGGPDIVSFEELENLNVLKALLKTHLAALGYKDYLLVPVPGSAINVGLLTRYPIRHAVTHAVSNPGGHPLRAILEVQLDCGGTPLYLFVCHWKSKSGGAQLTEAKRIEAAGIIVTREREILDADPSAEIVVLGDLNESVDEYERDGGLYQTGVIAFDGVDSAGNGTLPASVDPEYLRQSILVAADPALVPGWTTQRAADSVGARTDAVGGTTASAPRPLVLYSPWGRLGAGGTHLPSNEGSYWYRGDWETIDQFLLSPGLLDDNGLTFADFQIVKPDYLVDAHGRPLAWNSQSGTGYSDHLPVLLILRRVAS